ncbi:MAG: hypothetical protein COT18_12580 [Elusimicrobia bacterium CG08_land_8_20_14_0_20_59_10]|nr:MAG: hypothetical protein COT18_12580 [Elusimicrobia bacterium CG08_land_8_20_14_0_20_59_10]
MAASKNLPPLIRTQLTLSASVINTETGNIIFFKIIKNRTAAVKISLVVDGVAIKDVNNNAWDKKSEIIPRAQNSDAELPYEKEFSVIWKGEMSSGQLADGPHTLKLKVWDTDNPSGSEPGNPAPTNSSDPSGIASVDFLDIYPPGVLCAYLAA